MTAVVVSLRITKREVVGARERGHDERPRRDERKGGNKQRDNAKQYRGNEQDHHLPIEKIQKGYKTKT